MHSDGKNSLSGVLTNVALDALNLQARLDLAHEVEIDWAERLAKSIDPVYAQALPVMIPSRLQVTHHKFSMRVRLRTETTRGLELTLLPVNLGFAVRHNVAESAVSGFTVLIEQVPMPKRET